MLNGTKIFITNGSEADIVVVFATIDKSLRHKGITPFIVDKDTPGFSEVRTHEIRKGISRIQQVTIVRRLCHEVKTFLT